MEQSSTDGQREILLARRGPASLLADECPQEDLRWSMFLALGASRPSPPFPLHPSPRTAGRKHRVNPDLSAVIKRFRLFGPVCLGKISPPVWGMWCFKQLCQGNTCSDSASKHLLETTKIPPGPILTDLLLPTAPSRTGSLWLAHLHHQHHGVQRYHGHDGVLEGWGDHKVPDAVLEGVPVLGHVPREGFGADGKVNTGPLE